MQVNGPAAALVAATDYTLLVLGGIVVSVFLTSLLLSVIFCRSSLAKTVKIILEGKVTCRHHRMRQKNPFWVKEAKTNAVQAHILIILLC
jgi:hypothetical protein